jgi:hypothetical protein
MNFSKINLVTRLERNTFHPVADPGFFFRGANLIKKTKRASVYFFLIKNL